MTGSEHGEGVRERGHGGEREKKTKTPLGGTPCREKEILGLGF